MKRMMVNVSIDKYVLLQFKNGLREQVRELQQTIDRVERDIRDAAGSGADSLDLSSCNATTESMAARNSQNHRKLKMVELALERIQNGSFGACVACGGAIGLKRLQAIPSANRCLECQDGLERGTLEVVAGSNPTSHREFIHNVGGEVVSCAASVYRCVNDSHSTDTIQELR
jgi:DnaK suppressor protein